jgi:hypothetical protein
LAQDSWVLPQIPHLRSCRPSRRSNSPTGNPYRSLRWVSDTPAGRARRRSSRRKRSVSVHIGYLRNHQKMSIIAIASQNFSMCHLLRGLRNPCELGNSTLLDFRCQAFSASTKGARTPAPCKSFVWLKLGTRSFFASTKAARVLEPCGQTGNGWGTWGLGDLGLVAKEDKLGTNGWGTWGLGLAAKEDKLGTSLFGKGARSSGWLNGRVASTKSPVGVRIKINTGVGRICT